VFNDDTGESTSRYALFNCSFINNTAPNDYNSFDTTLNPTSEWRGQGIGGALAIYFQGNSSGNEILISGCIFVGNIAKWGAGLHVLVLNEATGNVLEVEDSTFLMNRAIRAGGGVCIRYFRSDTQSIGAQNLHNIITLRHVQFLKNKGNFGGATAVLSSYTNLPSTSKISFYASTWDSNCAYYSPTVEVAPALFQRLENGHLPTFQFIHCTFINNFLRAQNEIPPSYVRQYAGIFITVKSTVHFAGRTNFSNNANSALYVNSGKIVFEPRSEILFAKNRAYRGGGITAYAYSSIIINRDSYLHFMDNHISELGAGIYYETFDQHDFKVGRECFLKLGENTVANTANNIMLQFKGNKASIKGDSIYASTFYPCFYSQGHKLSRFNSTVLDFIGNISYDNNDTALATRGRHFDINNLKP